MFSGFLIVDYSKRKNYIFTNEPDQRQRERISDVMQWCKLITSFGMKHELFNIGFDFQKNKKNGFVIIRFYCLIKFYIIRFPFFTRFLLKVVFLIISKIPVQTPSLCRAPLLGRSDRMDRSVYYNAGSSRGAPLPFGIFKAHFLLKIP